jgi:hypothetical protein
MADSSSSDPPNAEALWLSEPAIRGISPYAKHIIFNTSSEQRRLRGNLAWRAVLTVRGLVYLGRVKL